ALDQRGSAGRGGGTRQARRRGFRCGRRDLRRAGDARGGVDESCRRVAERGPPPQNNPPSPHHTTLTIPPLPVPLLPSTPHPPLPETPPWIRCSTAPSWSSTYATTSETVGNPSPASWPR